MISVERFVCITRPLHVRHFADNFFSLGLPSVVLVNGSIGSLSFWAYDHTEKKCWGSPHHITIFKLLNYLLSIFYSYAPLLIIAVCNTGIVGNIVRQRRILGKSRAQGKAPLTQFKTAKILLAISASEFFCCDFSKTTMTQVRIGRQRGIVSFLL